MQTLILSLIPLWMSLMLYINSIFISMEMTIFQLHSFFMSLSLILDWFSCLFLSTVLFISSMILMFSIQYIPYPQHKQFSALLLMFVASMSILILSDNLIFILIGWDGLGLSSYILVIYYQNYSSAASGSITVLTNRAGDIMILMTISMLLMNPSWNFPHNENFPLFPLILITLAACSKSAQFPFSAWLPAAMAAPTPISALVHSSTLVTAGVYLLIRILNYNHPLTMNILMMISTLTVIYSSLSACWEQDMKKIIALSTLSQIAMMMFAISIGSTTLAFFHLIIHALFKSLMFLSAGVMIHSSSYQDMRSMSNFTSPQPIALTALGVSNLALLGTPFMSGFFSKDSIVEMTMLHFTLSSITPIMILSISMTTIYSFRLLSKAMKISMNSKPDIITQYQFHLQSPICVMLPTSVFSGAIFMWMIIPEQSFIIPLKMKISILFMILMGLIIGSIPQFKMKSFMKMGSSAISIWLNHLLSTSFNNKLNSPMSMLMKNDKQWQEMYGPNQIFSYNMISSFFPMKPLFTWMFISLLTLIFTLLILL